MRIRTTKYMFKEGFINAYRNKLMSLASLGVVTASLLIFGLFFIVSITLNTNLEGLKEQPEIQVFCLPELDDHQIQEIEETIKKDERVREYTVVSKGENFQKLKTELLENREDLLKGLDESMMSVSFILKMKDPADGEKVVIEYREMEGISSVKHPREILDIISRVTYWIPLVCILILFVLLIVSMFIISNTIKLTVFARRREISIMKYIGATDWFIRWPFIVEGVIIGCIGAIFAFIVVSFGYSMFESKFSNDFAHINLVKLVSMGAIWPQVIVTFLGIGTFIGALGSFISIRKYLRV